MAEKQKAEMLEHTLRDLNSRIDGLEHLLVLHRDGTLLGSLRPASTPQHVTTIPAEFANLTDKICLALEQGAATEAIVKGAKRFVAIYKTPQNNVFLAIMGKSSVNFGLLSSGGRIAIEKIQQVFHE